MFENGFDFNPLEVGNPMTLGLIEELQESQVNDAMDYIRKHYGDELTLDQMNEVIEMFDIDYPHLPHWLQMKFDEVDIIDVD